jgi:hypothetical protein
MQPSPKALFSTRMLRSRPSSPHAEALSSTCSLPPRPSFPHSAFAQGPLLHLQPLPKALFSTISLPQGSLLHMQPSLKALVCNCSLPSSPSSPLNPLHPLAQHAASCAACGILRSCMHLSQGPLHSPPPPSPHCPFPPLFPLIFRIPSESAPTRLWCHASSSPSEISQASSRSLPQCRPGSTVQFLIEDAYLVYLFNLNNLNGRCCSASAACVSTSSTSTHLAAP